MYGFSASLPIGPRAKLPPASDVRVRKDRARARASRRSGRSTQMSSGLSGRGTVGLSASGRFRERASGRRATFTKVSGKVEAKLVVKVPVILVVLTLVDRTEGGSASGWSVRASKKAGEQRAYQILCPILWRGCQ